MSDKGDVNNFESRLARLSLIFIYSLKTRHQVLLGLRLNAARAGMIVIPVTVKGKFSAVCSTVRLPLDSYP